MWDLRNIDRDILTLGKYLQPSSRHLTIDRNLTPEELDQLKQAGEKWAFGM
jgi:lipoic acid synthetase